MSADQAQLVLSGLRHGFEQGITRSEAWRRRQLRGLRQMLVERADDFERALLADLGKSPVESQLTEIGFLIAEIDHALAKLSKWIRARRVSVPLALLPATAKVVPEPLGVVLIIAPWNYPLMLALSPLIGALAAGNAAVVKPSELAPVTSRTLALHLPEAVDRRAVAVVEGGAEAVEALLRVRFDHVFYTGNGRVGRLIACAAAEHLTPVTLELGGKSPAYVDETGDLRAAARRVAWGKFLNAGQTCVAPDYVLATPQVLERLQPLLIEAIHTLYGNAIARNPDYGRIVNKTHLERLIAYLDDGDVVCGGEFDRDERYLAPTVLAGVARESAVMREEIFGPVLPLVAVGDLDDAIGFVRGGEKPLAAYVFSDDGGVRERWLRETSSGALAYGAPVLHLSAPELPFGGVGESGQGSYHGERSFRVFSHEKAVLTKPTAPDTLAATVMPPYTPAKERLVRRFLSRFL